ncbi:coiled-coil domain-containing protein [Algoriphagus resistens]|uniref:hypothetical protein n=1 Tax=Algoriphagus resistens TaxID=1750590 RepID=UPI0007169ED8|nr:hypothetical protein [Algoriphagus resistens]
MASKTEQRKIQIIADGSSVNASMEQMTKASRVLWQEMKKLDPTSEAFAEKSKKFQEVKGRLDDTTKTAKGTTAALGDMTKQAMAMSPFGGIITTITSSLGKANTMIKVVTASTNLFKLALASTGIGLVVIALGALINYLTTTQAGIDKVNKVLTPMRVIFEKLQGVVQNLGGNVFKGLSEMLHGNVMSGFKTIGKGALQAGEEIGSAFKDGIEQGGQLADMNIRIEETEIELTKSRAELNKKYQEAKEIAQDQSLSEAERLQAARDAQDAQNELLDQEQNFMDLKIERMKLEQTFNDTSREGYQELANLEAERTQFEATAAKKRASAKALENTVSKEIHAENMKRSDEARKKEEENIKRLDALRKEYLKATLDLEKQIEDVRIALMDEGLAKKEAKMEVELERELAKMEERRVKLLENETLTEEERQAVRDQFAELEELKRQENREALAELKEAEREEDIEKELEQFEEDQERETLLLENAFIGAVDAEMRKKEALLQIQREYAAEKLALLEATGQGESIQALKLKNTIAQIDKDIADNKIAEAQRAEDFKNQIQMLGFENARTWMQLGLDLLGEESKARKVFANAMKAVEIGQITMMAIKEVQAIWAGASTLGPIAGPIVGALQTGIAVGRAAIAVNKVRTTKYATGGATGSGKVIDMVMGAGGSWFMPNGQSARNVGSFARGGHVGTASFGVIGEAGSEWVGPNWMMRSPKYANIFGYLEAERRKATPFATGGATAPAPQLPQNSSATADLQQTLAMIEQFGEMNMKLDMMITVLQEWPQRLRVYNDPRDIMDGIKVLNEIENDSKINR